MHVGIRIGAALALVAAGLAVPVLKPGDVNGDAVIDILDVQRMFTAMAQQAEDLRRFDLNGDGEVNVLDLHIVLANATYAQSTEREATEPERPSATVPAQPQVPSGLAVLPRLSLQIAEPVEEAIDLARLEIPLPRPPKTERYLFHLTPNAPPHVG